MKQCIMLEKQMSVQCHVKFYNAMWPSVKSINHYIHMDGEYSIRNATFECSKIFFYNKFTIFSEIVIFNILFSLVPIVLTFHISTCHYFCSRSIRGFWKPKNDCSRNFNHIAYTWFWSQEPQCFCFWRQLMMHKQV